MALAKMVIVPELVNEAVAPPPPAHWSKISSVYSALAKAQLVPVPTEPPVAVAARPTVSEPELLKATEAEPPPISWVQAVCSNTADLDIEAVALAQPLVALACALRMKLKVPELVKVALALWPLASWSRIPWLLEAWALAQLVPKAMADPRNVRVPELVKLSVPVDPAPP